METVIFVLHVISCLFLVGLILIQHGQGANIGAAFGGSSQTVFGSRGPATFLNKLTVIVAVVFLSASIFLAHAEKNRVATSVIDEAKTTETKPAVSTKTKEEVPDSLKTEPAQQKAATPEQPSEKAE